VAKRRRREPEPPKLKDGDFAIPLGPNAGVVAPTMELETADLKEMSLYGEAKAKPNLVIQTGDGRLLELQPGWSQDIPAQGESGTPSIIVDDGLVPQALQVQKVAPKRQVRLRTEPSRGGGAWVIVLAYLLAGTALGLAIYERFVL